MKKNATDRPVWTLGDLAARAEAALARDPVGQTNGQVREIPDLRTIRYYTTLGLLDRPASFRGRTALYGHRHLRQLVAVKRLQAQGLRLAEIQCRLIGLDDAGLARIARVPSELGKDPLESAAAEECGPAKGDALAPSSPTPSVHRPAFWKAEPAPLPEAAEAGPPTREASGAEEVGHPTSPPRGAGLRLLGLGSGLHLLLEVAREPGEDDLEALRDAATSLAREVARRGLQKAQKTVEEEN